MSQSDDNSVMPDVSSGAETQAPGAPLPVGFPFLSPGDILSDRFQVTRFIAAGGMGLVFEAYDLEVRESVAIKVIRPDLLADEIAQERFLREVQIARKVTHPNVCRTFDVFRHRPVPAQEPAGKIPEITFISMELLPGETLATRIERGRLTTAEAFPILQQLAAALAAAHTAGVIHRDFKSKNVILVGAKDDVRPVVTDFGLARGESVPSSSVTDSSAMLGTPAYMAPEQVERSGKITPAVDIYALGVVLYEMVSGRRPFEADNPLREALARLTERPCPPRIHVPNLDPRWESMILRCLERQPDDRFLSALDAVAAVTGGKVKPSPKARRRMLLRIAAAAALLVILAAVVGLWALLPQPPTGHRIDISRLNFERGVALQAEISPDGNLVCYVSDTGGNFDLWVQHINGRNPFRLTYDEALDWMPSFSPDGSRIVFRSERNGGGIYLVETLGGEQRKIVDRGWFPRFSPDGSTISYCDTGAWFDPSFNKMHLVPALGGVPKPFQPDFGGAEWPFTSGPVWSPDGRHILFAGQRGKDSNTWEWYVAPVGGGPPVNTGALSLLQKQLQGGIYAPSAWRDDFIYFSSGSSVDGVNVFRLKLKSGVWQAIGPPEQITSGPGVRSQCSVARDARLVFSNLNISFDLFSLLLHNADRGITSIPERIQGDATVKREPSVTHDGNLLLYSSYGGREEPAKLELRVRDLNSGSERVVYPSGGVLATYPLINADGTAIGYTDWVRGDRRGYLIEGVGGVPREICQGCRLWAFFNRTAEMVVRERTGQMQRFDPATGMTRDLLLASNVQVLDVSLSWDDAWLAVHVGRPNSHAAIYCVPVRDRPVTEGEWQLIIDSERWLGYPRWSSDGDMIYFLADFDGTPCLYAQRLQPGKKIPAGKPLGIYHAHGKPFFMMGFHGTLGLAVARSFAVLVHTDITGSIWALQIID